MENQDSLLDTNLFGVQETSVLTDDDIFGTSNVTADHKEIIPVKKEEEIVPPKEEKVPEATLTIDDILEEEETEEKEEEVKEEKEDKSSDSMFTNLSKELTKLGVFTEREDVELPKTDEEFAQRWELESQEKVNKTIYDFLQSKGQAAFDAFNALVVNGVSPKDYVETFAKIQDFKDLDISIESNQEKVVRESLKRQGLKDDIISKKITKLKDYGDLEEEATSLHEVLVTQDEEDFAEMQEAAKQKELLTKQRKDQYTNTINDILVTKLKEKDFDGLPITEKVARKAFDSLTTEKWQLPTGEKLTDFDKAILELKDPKNYEKLVKLQLLLDNDLDFSKIKNTAISKKSDKLFETLVVKDKEVKKGDKTNIGKGFFDLLK
jgi:hypothetical protein